MRLHRIFVALSLLFTVAVLGLSGLLLLSLFLGGDRTIPLLPTVKSCLVLDKELGVMVQESGCVEKVRRGDTEIEAKFDEKGLRPPLGPASAETVLVLGSSHIAGFGLSDFETLPLKALQTEAGKALKRPLRWINGSTKGHSTAQLALRLPSFLASYHPKLVVVQSVGGPRAFMDAVLWDELVREENGRPVRVLPLVKRLPAPLRPFLNQRTRAFLLTFSDLWDRTKKAWQLRLLPARERTGAVMAPTIMLLRAMREDAERSGACFLVLLDGRDANDSLLMRSYMVQPLAKLAQWLLPEVVAQHEEIEKSLREADLPVAVMDRDFVEGQQPEHLLADGYHWNELGSRHFGKFAWSALAPYFSRPSSCRSPSAMRQLPIPKGITNGS